MKMFTGGAVLAMSIGLLFVTGCDTLNSFRGRPMSEQERVDRQKAKQEQSRARQQAEDNRQRADSERRARDRQRDEARQLRERYERYSTAELRLMHDRYLELATGGSGSDLNVRVNSLLPSNTDKAKMEQVIEIERELLRRWKDGDKGAKLPNFDN
jgi:hypothetical protein